MSKGEEKMEGWTFWNVGGKWFGKRLADNVMVRAGTYSAVLFNAEHFNH
jgi:hypothetical protein